jgi:hypothetical protein
VVLTSISCAIGVERGQGQASVVMLSVAKPASFRGERLGFGEQIDRVETKHSGMPRKSSQPWEPGLWAIDYRLQRCEGGHSGGGH